MHAKTADAITKIIDTLGRIALIGASPKAERPANDVMRHMLGWGYDVVPVNPGQAGSDILDQMTYATLADIPGPIDTVDLFVASERVGAIIDQAIALKDEKGIKTVWLQLGIHDEAACERAVAAGLNVVTDHCVKIEVRSRRNL